MPWNTILPGLAALLASLTGLQITKTDMPQKVTDSTLKAQLEFRITSCVGIGEDEWRYVADTDPTQQHLTICGHRAFTLQVKCTSYDATNTNMAPWYLERIYTRLSRPANLAAMDPLGVAWTDAGPTLDLGQVISEEERIFSIGVKDFMFTAVVNDADTDPADDPQATIQHVNLTSNTLNNVDGTPLPVQVTVSV